MTRWPDAHSVTPRADRAVIIVACVLLVTVGTAWSALADKPTSGEAYYRPLACTMPETP